MSNTTAKSLNTTHLAPNLALLSAARINGLGLALLLI
jgi:hypothetical protein